MIDPRFEIEGLSCMAGLRPLFVDLELALPPGRWIELTGPNGTGKSTLLRAIAGLIRPVQGSMRWQRSQIVTTSSAWRRTVLYQGHASALKDTLTCAENLALGLALDQGGPVSSGQIDDLLGRVGLTRCRDLPAANLSAGQRRRIQLARLAAATMRPLWLLDEPGNALDRDGLQLLSRLIDDHLASGNVAIVATHQPVELQAPAIALAMPRFARRSAPAATVPVATIPTESAP